MITDEQVIDFAKETLAELLTPEKLTEIKTNYAAFIEGVNETVSEYRERVDALPPCALTEATREATEAYEPAAFEGKIIGTLALMEVTQQDDFFDSTIVGLIEGESLTDLYTNFDGIDKLDSIGFTPEEIAFRHQLPVFDVEEYLQCKKS